jgi:hypothetical protein
VELAAALPRRAELENGALQWKEETAK